jgi:Flp pilus assembly protein TadD
MNTNDDPNGLLKQGIAAFKSGDKQAAAKLLYQVTKADPNNQTAWLWLSGCVNGGNDHSQG